MLLVLAHKNCYLGQLKSIFFQIKQKAWAQHIFCHDILRNVYLLSFFAENANCFNLKSLETNYNFANQDRGLYIYYWNMLINLNLTNFTFVYMNAYLQRMLVLTYMKQIILS